MSWIVASRAPFHIYEFSAGSDESERARIWQTLDLTCKALPTDFLREVGHVSLLVNLNNELSHP